MVFLLGFRQPTDQIAKLLLRVGKQPYTEDEVEEKKVLIRKRTFEEMVEQLRAWDPKYGPVEEVDGGDVLNLLQKAAGGNGILTLELAEAFQIIWDTYWKVRTGESSNQSNSS